MVKKSIFPNVIIFGILFLIVSAPAFSRVIRDGEKTSEIQNNEVMRVAAFLLGVFFGMD